MVFRIDSQAKIVLMEFRKLDLVFVRDDDLSGILSISFLFFGSGFMRKSKCSKVIFSWAISTLKDEIFSPQGIQGDLGTLGVGDQEFIVSDSGNMDSSVEIFVFDEYRRPGLRILKGHDFLLGARFQVPDEDAIEFIEEIGLLVLSDHQDLAVLERHNG